MKVYIKREKWMIDKKNNIFVRGRFQLALNNRDCRYDESSKESKVKYSKKMLEYFANEKKIAVNLVDYFTGKINKHDKVNLIIENGSYATNKELMKRKEFIGNQIYNSNLWKLVVSFDNDYIDKNISLKDLEQKMIKEVIPRFLKKLEFKDLDKMMYQISLHANTDNYHFHIAFMEKEPNTINKNGSLAYRRLGKLKKSDYNYLKNLIAISIEREKNFSPMLKNINIDIEEFKKYFSKGNKNMLLKKHEDLILEENILQLGKLLYVQNNSNNRIKFNSIDDNKIRSLTKSIYKYLYNNDSEFKNLKASFDISVDKLRNYLYETGKSNNIKDKEIDYTIIKNKQEYLNNYIYNYLVNYSNNIYKYKKLKGTEEDIMKEIILMNYKKNKSMTKRDIVRNYLSSNKFQNKQEICKSIRNINYEMEEASEEFSKLFKNDEYEK